MVKVFKDVIVKQSAITKKVIEKKRGTLCNSKCHESLVCFNK